MKTKISIIIISVSLVVAVSFIIYQNFLVEEEVEHVHSESEELYTCGMHPDILTNEPGNCPICEMKLIPVKSESNNSERKILYWVAPMDPNEIYDSPGKSKMGMDLVPVYEDQLAGGSVVTIDPSVQQNMNLKTVEIETRDISPNIVTNAEITANERYDFNLTSRINGWVEKLYVSFEGEEIKEGQKLLDIYSPDVVTAQQELITALNYYDNLTAQNDESLLQSGEDLIKNSEKKLELLSISRRDIDEIKKNREVKYNIPIKSPTDGVVMIKNVVEGQKISDGDMIMQVTDLGKLWVMADVYVNELALINVGDRTITTVDAFPNIEYEGMVNFIYPTIDETTRTAKVRIDIENDYKKLKPSMLAKVKIEAEEIDDAVVVPEDAVIRSGSKNIAVIALGDGKFQPVEIRLGLYAEGYYHVLRGLNEGDRVVSSAQFLIDSESSLMSAIKQFSAADTTEMNSGAESEMDLVRTGIIDVERLDENGDGYLYECPMDWNVLSDEAGSCPTCNMDLERFSIDDVKKNLADTGYEYKGK